MLNNSKEEEDFDKHSNPDYVLLLERLQNKSLWIWDQQQHHTQEDRELKGECCLIMFHIIGILRFVQSKNSVSVCLTKLTSEKHQLS